MSAKSNPKNSGLRIGGISFKEKEYFVENLALLLKAAVPVGQAITSLQSSARSSQMKRALETMKLDIEAGSSLGSALESSKIVTGQTLALVQLGEQSGHLVENMQLAAQQEEKRHFFKARVRSALIYPTFVLSLTVIVGLGVAWFLLPRLAGTFSQLQADLPAITKIMIGAGIFLSEHGLIAVPAAALVGGVIGYILFGAKQTKFLGQKLIFMTPGISTLMRQAETAQFGYLLGTLLDAGLSITRAVSLLAEASGTLEYKKFYYYLAQSLEDGRTLKQSMEAYPKINKILPPSVQQMVVAGEHSGSLSEVLKTIGRTYEQKSEVTTQNLEAVLEPILLIIVWVGVMIVAVAVIVPIYSLIGGLS